MRKTVCGLMKNLEIVHRVSRAAANHIDEAGPGGIPTFLPNLPAGSNCGNG
jgi:hypothetical protein